MFKVITKLILTDILGTIEKVYTVGKKSKNCFFKSLLKSGLYFYYIT